MRRRKHASGATDRPSARSPSPGDEAPRRVHLRLYREPGATRDRVTLKAPVFEEDWQNALAEASANTGLEMLGGARELGPIERFGDKMAHALSGYLAGLLKSAEGSIACRPGCDHCCHQIVGATMPELLSIWSFLNSLPPPVLAAVAKKCSHAAGRAADLSPAARFSPDHPCPLLDGGVCSAYAARPLSCRGVHALDADLCKAILRDPDAHNRFLETGEGSPSYREPGRAVLSMSAGMQLCLSELYDLDMHPIDLTLGIARLFRDHEWPERWVRGERIPEAVKAGHASRDPRRRAITGERAHPEQEPS